MTTLKNCMITEVLNLYTAIYWGYDSMAGHLNANSVLGNILGALQKSHLDLITTQRCITASLSSWVIVWIRPNTKKSLNMIHDKHSINKHYSYYYHYGTMGEWGFSSSIDEKDTNQRGDTRHVVSYKTSQTHILSNDLSQIIPLSFVLLKTIPKARKSGFYLKINQ